VQGSLGAAYDAAALPAAGEYQQLSLPFADEPTATGTTSSDGSVDQASATDPRDGFDVNAAIASAKAARWAIGDVPEGKAVAATEYGQRTLSGWEHGSDPGSGYAPPADDLVMAQAQGMNFRFRRAGAADGDIPGRYYASHAEVQMTEVAPDEPIAVSRVMCPDCQKYFKALAQYTDTPQTIADLYDVRVFYPDGRVLVHDVRGTTILHPDGRIEGL